jgi:hypothetical protein
VEGELILGVVVGFILVGHLGERGIFCFYDVEGASGNPEFISLSWQLSLHLCWLV